MNLIQSLEKLKSYKGNPYHGSSLQSLLDAWEYGNQKINVNSLLSDRLGWWHDYSESNYKQLQSVVPIHQEKDLTAIQPHAKERIYLNNLLLFIMDKDPFSGEILPDRKKFRDMYDMYDIFDRLSSLFVPGKIEAFPQFFEWGYPGGEFKPMLVEPKDLIFQYIDDDSFSIGEYVIDVKTIKLFHHFDRKINHGYFTVLHVPRQLYELCFSGFRRKDEPYDYTAAPGKRYILLCLQRLHAGGSPVGKISELWEAK
jgi:hypothetical protein